MDSRDNIILLDSVAVYERLYGLRLPHPHVAVIDMNEATRAVNHLTVEYGLYALYLKNGVNCRLMYGRQPYDYQEGTVVSFAPGQRVGIESDKTEIKHDVVGLLFHPDFIFGTPLGEKIRRYSFFDYSQRESLHLSEQERNIFLECLARIKFEIENPADPYSADIISSHIQVILDYMERFYSRQFVTRKKVDSNIVVSFENGLKRYYDDGHGKEGLPSVGYFASQANLTPGYFGDLVKKYTGGTAQDIISRHVIALAKQRLASTADDVSIIAYDLGFQYPQHFSRQFKRVAGVSPTQFRAKRAFNKKC